MEWFSLESTVLLFVLGLRHGLDPDHIALIDNITLKCVEEKRSYSRWVGSFFALGHGLTVTLISVLISSFSIQLNGAKSFFTYTEWLPTLLLIVVGCANLHQLLKRPNEVPASRLALIPKSWNIQSKPIFIVFVGMVFAMVFDTTTQAAAWGYAASSPLNLTGAFILGAIFTMGMLLSDTIDSSLLNALLKKGLSIKNLTTYRRKLGWIIVILSFSVAGYQLLLAFKPSLQIAESYKLMFGLSFAVFVLFNYLYLFIKTNQKNGY
ncbi:high-affinity nickel-transport protein [Pedobacter sp. UYP24]